jgi:uncharacterized protein YjbJ (UPF0337 family)
MNKVEFAGKWKQIRGQAQQWWGKLTDNDLEQVGGKWEQFVDILHVKYGYTREVAEDEFNQRMVQFNAQQRHKKNVGQTPVQDIVTGKWQQMHSQAREWWWKLTDDELDKAAGKAETIFGLLQAEYGYSRDHAEAELKRRVKEYDISQQEHPVPITYFI